MPGMRWMWMPQTGQGVSTSGDGGAACADIRRLVPQTANERMDCVPGQRPAQSQRKKSVRTRTIADGRWPLLTAARIRSEPIIGGRAGGAAHVSRSG
jgi:hypothetical protein